MNRGKNAFISHTKKYITVEDFYKRKKKWSSLHSHKILNATSPFSRRVSFFFKSLSYPNKHVFWFPYITIILFIYFWRQFFPFTYYFDIELFEQKRKDRTNEPRWQFAHDLNIYIYKSTLSICCNDATSCLVLNAELHSTLKYENYVPKKPFFHNCLFKVKERQPTTRSFCYTWHFFSRNYKNIVNCLGGRVNHIFYDR